MNKAIIIGNLGSDPEVKFTSNNNAVCNFRMATSEKWTDKNGERKEETQWHRIVVWGKSAETAGEYLSKGSKVAVEGAIKTREWENKDGQKQWTTEIHANRFEFLDRKGEGGGSGGEQRSHGGGYGGGAPDDSDVPFGVPFFTEA